MTSKEKKPVTPPENVPTDAQESPISSVQQPENQPLDPKEEARRRSKEDLARKRSRLKNNRGKF